jgi:hypothetical protein
MIRAVLGKAGGGKTYWMMHCIERELVGSKRWVVTNLTDIKVPEFQAYLQAKYPQDPNLDLGKRLQIIPKTETRYWFRYRGHFTAPEFPIEPKRSRVETPEQLDARMQAYFSAINERDAGGVCYAMDEAHRHFSALEWATFAEIGIFYISQHRHLNDTFWFATQFPEQVNTTLRRSPQDCHIIRNHYVESFGWFKKPGCFFRQSYNFVPETKSQVGESYDTGKMSLDVQGLGNCYRTRGALGGEISVAEEKPPSRKLPFWAIPIAVSVMLLFVGLSLWMVPTVIASGMGAMLKKGETEAQKAFGVPAQPASELPQDGADFGPQSAGHENTPTEHQNSSYQPEPVRVLYTAVNGERYRVALSDGRVLTERDGLIRRIDSTGVELVNGLRLPIKLPASSKPARFAP